MQNHGNFDMYLWMAVNQFFSKIEMTPFITYLAITYFLFDYCLKNQTEIIYTINKFLFPDKKKGIVILKSHSLTVNNIWGKTINKICYSDYFIAFHYYFQKNLHEIKGYSSFEERRIDSNLKIGLSNDKYEIPTKEHYVFLPIGNTKILIHKKLEIYCDILETIQKSKSSSENSDKNSEPAKSDEKIEIVFYRESYTSECSTKIIFNFLEECLKDYNKMFEESISKQFIYEYRGCESLSENDSHTKIDLIYDEYECLHNKDLDTNIFFDDKEKLLKYIEPFIFDPDRTNHPDEEKYKKAGYAFKAGLLFHGLPGCGKTSTIKGILKKTRRNGVLINLNRVKTNNELEKIFRNYTINNRVYTGKQLCFIIEDCDAFQNDFLKKRESQEIEEDTCFKKNNSKPEETLLEKIIVNSVSTNEFSKISSDKISLSTFLNILDGIIELHGVMIIFTTNHPEKIDPALLRPGRIDFQIEFKKCSTKTIKQMLSNHFSNLYLKPDLLKQLDDYIIEEKFSPAEVQAILFQNINDIEACIKQLIQKCHNK